MTERMRFFSRAWQRGDFRDDEAEAIRDRYYQSYLPSMIGHCSRTSRRRLQWTDDTIRGTRSRRHRA